MPWNSCGAVMGDAECSDTALPAVLPVLAAGPQLLAVAAGGRVGMPQTDSEVSHGSTNPW